VNKDIGILAYADDSIYGRGAAPSGAPPATLTGGIDFASGSGVSMSDTTNMSFPNNINNSTSLASFPFVTPQTRFTPFDVTKTETSKNLIGKPMITTLSVLGNNMGPLRHFHLQDIIPANRAFSWIVNVSWGTVWGINITYDSPNPGEVTIDLTDIFVPTGSDITITYETIPLAYDASSYSLGIPVLNTGSVVPHRDPSPNTVTMHTGSLALSGGPYTVSTWNNGTSDIAVNAVSMVPPRTPLSYNRYANLSKTGNIAQAVIGDVITYTVTLDTALNAAFTTNGSGTYIIDKLPDGLTFSGTVSSLIVSGWGTPLTFISANTDLDGDTLITWRLNSGVIDANSTAQIVYQAVLDGVYEGAGDTEYENTEILTNDASFFGTVGDGGLSGIWGQTDPSKIDTPVYIHATNADAATADVVAPVPVTKKHLVSITVPGGTVYDYSTGLPSSIPAGSALRFALTMDFPEVNFINPKLIDALPLLAGPNTNAYDIAFQTNTTLKDIYNTGVLFNTNDGVTPDTNFNWLNLLGTNIPNAAWIQATPANNLEFQLNSGVGKKTFAILFTVNVLTTKPAGWMSTTWLVPLTNYAYSTCNNDSGTPLLLPVMDIPFTVNFPSVIATKTASGGTNVEAGKDIEYTVTLTNTGSSPAYIENIIDTLPVNMDGIIGSIVSSGSLTELPNSSITQSGNTLLISFDTWALSGQRSYLPIDNSWTPLVKENIVVIRYTVRPNTNFVIQGGATRTNTVNLDYYASSGAISNGVNNLWPVTTSANIFLKSPTVVRSLLSTSEADSAWNNLYVGEEVVYRTIISVPNGTFNLANYTESINSNLQFLSGTVIAYSWSLSFSSGTTFTWPTVNFGTITNNNTDTTATETIIIDTTYRVNRNATAGVNYNNNGTFTYSSTSVASWIVVNVRKPTLTLTKVASPTTGDAWDVITFTLTTNNTSTTAHAYDLRLTDLLPSIYMTYVTGSLSLGSFSGSEGNLFSMSGGGNGLSLDVLPALSGASVSFQVVLTQNVRPADMYTNRADIAYDTLDDDNSPYEWTGSTFATALVAIPDITLTHTVTSTSLANTTNALFSGSLADVAIGEHVFYTTTVGFPQSSITGVTFTQTLPVGMKFLSGYILFDGIKTHSLSNISISPDNIITFNLWDVDNTGIGAGTGIVIVTEAVMQDNVANTAWSTKTSNMKVDYAEKTKSMNTFVEVVEPALSIVKDYSPNSGDAGDTIPVTITVTNTSLVHAYDVVLTDIAPAKLIPWVGFSGTINIGTLAPGQVVTFTYDSVIAGNVWPAEILTGTASVLYTSHPGTPTDGERTYSALDTDSVTILNAGSIQLNLLSTSDVKIGDVSQYEIKIPVTEGTINTLDISSLIPAGMVVIPGSIVITPDASISYSGSVTPLITPDSSTIGAWQTQAVTYNFSTVINTNTNNATTEYITIRYDAVTQDSTDTNNGNQKNHTVSALYDSLDTKSWASLPVTIREPNVVLTVSNGYAYGHSVPYTFTLTNSGSATAYDLDLSTLLPSGVSYTGSITITNSGWAVNLVRVGDTYTLDSLPVNPGNPLVFTIVWEISESVPNYTPLTLTGTVIYTSQPGSYTPPITNSLTLERTSAGWVDDYIDANKTTAFILNIPLLDERITVSDINGGDGIIGDVFEYTITLTNTGNVALTNIPVTLDIPSGFTGFTFMSTPAGSINLSTATGWVNGAWYLSLSGINIPIGWTAVIVYRVEALKTLSPGTVIPTQANVGNSSEWAIGGTPNVPVTINAPVLVSTATETDVNGWGKLLRDEKIHHTLTLSNSGTATGTNVFVTIPWSTGSTYVSGSLRFQTGTLVNVLGAFVDEISNTITFTIPALPPGATEVFDFDSIATGPIGASISTTLSATANEWVSTTVLSNPLVIVNMDSGWGGWTPSVTPPVTPGPKIPQKSQEFHQKRIQKLQYLKSKPQ
jgi:uncharacterized repeat protein (TIGR01451 family)/fimbrial isopeptide formation D2 family protein